MDTHPTALRRAPLAALFAILLAACSNAAGSSALPAQASPSSAPSDAPSASAALTAPTDGSSAAPSDQPATEAPSQPPDTGGGTTTAGDVPDNAVFLTYHNVAHAFSIQYVEGWQVTTGPDGVVVRDKDSSETVTVVASPADVGAYISGTDLPALRAQAGFTLVKQNRVTFGSRTYDHLVIHLPSPADPVTGKRIPSTVDRYYVPGASGLAIVSLSTPDGVDNVDAFRQMIESFTWS